MKSEQCHDNSDAQRKKHGHTIFLPGWDLNHRPCKCDYLIADHSTVALPPTLHQFLSNSYFFSFCIQLQINVWGESTFFLTCFLHLLIPRNTSMLLPVKLKSLSYSNLHNYYDIQCNCRFTPFSNLI